MTDDVQAVRGGVKPYYEDGSVTIYHGDCREILPTVEADVSPCAPSTSTREDEG